MLDAPITSGPAWVAMICGICSLIDWADVTYLTVAPVCFANSAAIAL